MPPEDVISPEIVARFLVAEGDERCLLLVHPDVGKLAAAAEQIIGARGWARFPVGGPLSRALRDTAPRYRVTAIQRWVGQQLGPLAPGPVVCTEIGLLFELRLETGRLRDIVTLRPLDLLKQASRTTRLVVAWPGTVEGDVLTYAVPEHAHYKAWPKPTVIVVPLA